MRLVVLAEDAPDRSAATGNGSTMIPANVIPLLSEHLSVDLAYFDSGRNVLDGDTAKRCRSLLPLPLRSRRASVLATPTTALPRATWRRAGPDAVGLLRPFLSGADAVWVHGLHAFAAALAALPAGSPTRVIAHEVDPWSAHWEQRARTRRQPKRTYDRGQARRAARLEQRMAAVAASYLVVAPLDAQRLSTKLGRPVLALPNGVTASAADAGSGLGGPDRGNASLGEAPGPVIGFLGSLDYPPNVEAVHRLATAVLPRVRAQAPDAVLRIAGRRAGPAVRSLSAPGLEVVGEVADPAAFYRSVQVMAFPGESGTGTKNTLNEALLAGAAVVASRQAARGVADEGQLLVADGDEAIASLVCRLLADESARNELRRRAADWALAGLPTWERSAAVLESLLRPA